MEIVTVIITTHNRPKDLEKAILSVIKQTYIKIDIIVVDDCSGYDTEILMSTITSKYQNIQYIRLEKPSGANVARNKGIQNAKGYYITGLDDDDIMLPERITKMVEAMNDDLSFVYTDVYYKLNNKMKHKKFKKNITLNDMLYFNQVGNQVLAKKDSFIEAGYFDEKILASQDYDMWLRMMMINENIYCVREPLMIIDQTTNTKRISTSKNKFKGYVQVYNKYKKFYNISQRKTKLLKLLNMRKKKISINLYLKLFTIYDYKSSIVFLFNILKGK